MASLEEHISTQLDGYISHFNALDFSSAASHYHEPCVSISAACVTILPKRDDMAGFFAAAIERLRRDGWTHSVYAGPKNVVVLDEKGLVLASCRTKRLRGDGTSCEEFTATYTLRKAELEDEGEGQAGRWLIVAIHHHCFETQLG